jgi:hypothetical protein
MVSSGRFGFAFEKWLLLVCAPALEFGMTSFFTTLISLSSQPD